MGGFDYSSFPAGYYDEILTTGPKIQKAWHLQKFNRIGAILTAGPAKRLLDIGCFAGTFLSLLGQSQATEQVGVDILMEQITYAKSKFGNGYRKFQFIESIDKIASVGGNFDVITLIEVIEHLSESELKTLFQKIDSSLNSDGRLIITTPNYLSFWPALEILIKRFSGVDYQEQHLTHFFYPGIVHKLNRISPIILEKYLPELKTTSHFLAPFLAVFSLRFSNWVSRAVNPRKWRMPFGALIVLVLRKAK